MKEALKIRLLDDLLAVLTGWKKIGEEGERGRDASGSNDLSFLGEKSIYSTRRVYERPRERKVMSLRSYLQQKLDKVSRTEHSPVFLRYLRHRALGLE